MNKLKMIWTISKIVIKVLLVLLFVVGVGWLCVMVDFNIGGIIRKIWGGGPKTYTPKIIGPKGELCGKGKMIFRNPNPARDKTRITVEGGHVIQLPKGVKDTDVFAVLEIEQGVYDVKIKHELTTNIFN